MRQGRYKWVVAIAAFLSASTVFTGCRNPGSPSTPPRAETRSSSSIEAAPADPLSKPGFVNLEEENRLWVLRPGEEKQEKHVTLVGAGPNGMTIKALKKATALEYLATKPGFVAKADEDGRIWIFREGELKEMLEKHVTRINAGPMKTTIKAVDREVLDAYLVARKLE